MPRSGPPFREPITYFRWDAKEWIRLHRTGWSIGKMNTTVDALWLLHPAIQNHYITSRAADERRQPGLPAQNRIPARPNTRADLTHVQNHDQLPQPAGTVPAPIPTAASVPAPAAAAAPVPVPVPVPAAGPAPAPPLGGAAHAPVAQGVDAGTQAAQVNTKNFLYQPNFRAVNQELPPMLNTNDDEDKDEKEREAAKRRRMRRFEEAGLCDPGREGRDLEWRCANILGQGSTGTVTLWIGVDESRTITERLAVRDVVVESQKWIGPIFWRDKLPMELAIQTRLERRKAHEHHVHRYHGHRIDVKKRRFRVFNEVCDMGDICQSLDWYSRRWRRRRNMFRWQNSHPEIRNILRARGDIPASGILDVNQQEQDLKAANDWTWYAFEKKQFLEAGKPVHATVSGELPLPTNVLFDEYKNMSELDDWHGDPLPVDLPEVIPEWFLWIVFDQLVDAFTMLGSGRINEEDDDVDWNKIVHRDGHLENVFVKPADGAVGKEISKEDGHQCRQFGAHEAPSIVLADFDLAFFDLRSGNDDYADNPTHYMMRNHPLDAKDAGRRYAPEMFWCYEGHYLDERPSEKMTARTDVWQVGQMMWNLVMNLPGKDGFVQEPFTYTVSDEGEGIEKLLNDGSEYDIQKYKDDLFSGKMPFEASNMYSKTLKNTIIECMDYRQHKRSSFADLKRVTKEWAGKKLPPGSKSNGDLIICVSEAMEEFGLEKTYGRSKKRRT